MIRHLWSYRPAAVLLRFSEVSPALARAVRGLSHRPTAHTKART